MYLRCFQVVRIVANDGNDGNGGNGIASRWTIGGD